MNNSVKILLLLIALVGGLLAWVWVSGYFFLMLAGLDKDSATLTTLYEYYTHYSNDEVTLELMGKGLFLGVIAMLVPLSIFFVPKKISLYGDAKFATLSDIRKAGLLGEKGIIVGKTTSFLGLGEKYLHLSGSLHALLAAPTRSGKGVGVVIPNCLSWPDSMIVLDIKQENWSITSGFRSKHGQDCFLLNLAPRDYKTHRWNPLFYISDDPAFRINDIQKIGQMLFPSNEHEAPIWQAASRSLWLGIVLYLIESEDLPVTLGETLRQLTQGDNRLGVIIDKRQKTDNPFSAECYLAMKEYLDTPEKTRGSVRKGFLSALELFYNPVIDAATAGNDFDLRDIRKKRLSIYVGISPDDLDRLSPLINLFFQQAIDLNTRELPEDNPELKYQCLLLADEFTAIGKVNILSKGISYIAGYGLRMLPIIQSPAQLRDVYGAEAAESFIDNHALRIVFPPKNIKTAKEISETLGTMTVKNKSKGRSSPSDLFGKSSVSSNTSQHGRALLLPQEVMQMEDDKCILLLENTRPILCKKIKWFQDDTFIKRGNGRDGINWSNPEVPKIDPSTLEKGNIDFANSVDSTNKVTVERAIEIKDLEEMNLDDFTCDFSEIDIPKGDISDDEMNTLAMQFMNTIQPA